MMTACSGKASLFATRNRTRAVEDRIANGIVGLGKAFDVDGVEAHEFAAGG